MAEKGPVNNAKEHKSSVEHAERSTLKDLEAMKKPEASTSKAEYARAERELAEKGAEAKRKLAAEKEKGEKDHTAEKLDREEKHREEPEAKKAPARYTTAEKKVVYKREMKKVQAQLPRGSRTFSRVVHNPVVEKVSDVSGKTIFRPSALIGGAITGLLLGIVIYIAAQYFGYVIPNITLLLLLVIGAVIGVVAEFIFHRFHRVKES